MATIDELRQEPHWSYSALNTYLNICQAQFMYRYVDQAEVERTSVCFPFGKAFHAALTAQAWECMTGNSLRQDELVERFSEAFRIEAEATPNLIYKEGENFDTVIALATKMLDAALAKDPDYVVKLKERVSRENEAARAARFKALEDDAQTRIRRLQKTAGGEPDYSCVKPLNIGAALIRQVWKDLALPQVFRYLQSKSKIEYSYDKAALFL